MPALLFPSLNVLRLALTSSLVPQSITHSPALAGLDAQKQLWVELTELPPSESLAALSRLGIRAYGRCSVPTEAIGCWAEVLPLEPLRSLENTGLLILVPDRYLGRLVARLRRSAVRTAGIALSVSLPGAALVRLNAPASNFPTELAAILPEIEVYWEQASGVWVTTGWCHVAPDQLCRPPNTVLILQPPRRVRTLTDQIPPVTQDEFQLRFPRSKSCHAPVSLPLVLTQVRLVPRHEPLHESLWILPEAAAATFWDYCSAADERLIQSLEVGEVSCGNETRLAVRTSGTRPVSLPLSTPGYSPDTRLPGLYLPSNRQLRPALRGKELSRALGITSDRIIWLEATQEGYVIPHSMPVSVFQPLTTHLEYTTPAPIRLDAVTRSAAFGLLPLPHPTPTAPVPESDAELDLALGRSTAETLRETMKGVGWLWRSLRKLKGLLRVERQDRAQTTGDSPEGQALAPPPARVEQKLESTDSLLHGRGWASRRMELEERLVRELPRVGPALRAALWGDLAVVYSSTGNPADAAICWMNALWECPSPPVSWYEHWLKSECRAARFSDHTGGLERWLSEPERPGMARIIAAYTALNGLAWVPTAEFVAQLPRILGYLDQHFEELPLRAAWLAQSAITRACNGDALGLARWGTRVVTRLSARGPGLDLDEPSFLRFHGTLTADRFLAARDWVIRLRDPILHWIKKQSHGRLLKSGLDAETDATAAYAQFMLAWGLGCLGERARSKDWAARARKELRSRSTAEPDYSPHTILSDLFLERVRDAQEGRSPKSGLPPEVLSRVEALPYLDRYAVDKLRERSRILEPLARVRAYRGLETKVFWGNDRLGERLFLLAGRTDASRLTEEADALLRICTDTPTTSTVPRIVLTLLDAAAQLDLPVLRTLLHLVPTALDWMEAWLQAGPWRDDERPRMLVTYQSRLIEASFTAVTFLPPTGVVPAVGGLLRAVVSSGDSVRRATVCSAGSVFRVLRRFGLQAESESLVRFLVPERSDPHDPRHSPDGLALAMGWYTAGNEDAGNRLLNVARETLYSAERPSDLAQSYAEALGFAPARIAYGRLEELFQRLGSIRVMGATNRYYTLQPLQLIDTVVRSVVSEELTFSPAVRAWLADDEFLIRRRIQRDLDTTIREEETG